MINKKKLINTNKIFGERVYQDSSLDFDLDMANRQNNIFKKLAYATRPFINTHPFTDANKRTALVMIKSELADRGIKCDQKKLVKSLVKMTKTRESRINIIERRIRKVCQKNTR